VQPFISVIVTAYNRKHYLLNAVNSAINQMLPKEFYEIIVAKNFYDDFIDAKLKETGIRTIYSDQRKSGAMVADAVGEAQGDVISFLDDDDEFVPMKLESVFRAFQMGADYHYNNQKTMNELGQVAEGRIRPSFFTGDKQRYLNFLIKRRLAFNSSSISIRKKIVEKEIEALKRINISVDTFYLVCYLLHGDKLFYDGRPLTVYRVRSKQKNHISQGLSASADEIRKAELYARDYSLMIDMTRGTPYEVLPRFRLAWAKAMRAKFSNDKKGIDQILAPRDLMLLMEFQPKRSLYWGWVAFLQWLPREAKQLLSR